MSDRRTRKTKAQLRAALTKLLEQKKINEITVKEIVEEADINRSTFYLHYNDIYDLLHQIEKELLNEFIDLTKEYEDFHDDTNADFSYLTKLFEILSNNIDIVSILLGPNGDISFLNQIKHMIADKIIENFKEDCIKNNLLLDVEYTFSFYLNGCIGLIEQWIKSGLKHSPEHMAKICYNLINNGIRSYFDVP